MSEQTTCRIHRFHDFVAIYLGTGETVYLTPHQSREIGIKLTEFAADIDNCRFVDSSIETYSRGIGQ